MQRSLEGPTHQPLPWLPIYACRLNVSKTRLVRVMSTYIVSRIKSGSLLQAMSQTPVGKEPPAENQNKNMSM